MGARGLSASAKTSTLVFDGDCGFCTTSVNWLQRKLPVMPAVTPFQWADLDSLGLTIEEARERVWLVTPGHQYGGHLAVSALLRKQRSTGLRFLGWLMDAPLFTTVAGLGYALVSRYRYRLPGGTPACKVGPPPS